MAGDVKMSYNAALARVRCEFTRAACLESEKPPEGLLARAKAKLDAGKQSGEIAFFYVYETRLAECWKALREAEDEPADRKVQITLAAGAPALGGIRVDKPQQEKSIATLILDAPADAVATWRWEWFKLAVIRRLRDAGIREAANMAQIYSAFTRARAGEKITGMPISSVPAIPPGTGGPAVKSFSVIANKQRMEIGVVIRSVKDLREKTARDSMLLLINQAVKQLSAEGVEYRLLKKDFQAALQSALDGPEGVGLDLPLVLLAAVGRPRGAPVKSFPGAGRIGFDVSKDKMEATVNGFRLEYYQDAAAPVTIEWLQNELKRCLIALPIAEETSKQLDDVIKAGEDLNGVVACRGTAGTGGREPYLHQSFKDAEGRAAGNLDEDALDIRGMQQRATVKAGQLIAEIRFKEAPKPGRSVYGEEVPPPPSDELPLRLGEGVQQREPGKFYALHDGLPVITSDSLSLSQVLVHEGDVNLSSGNISFDGPVEIKGSIDNGAAVYTTGDLVVHGSIRSAQVRSLGSITAHSGITSGATGKVEARHEITAEFIESSTIICGGTLTVKKALLSSKVFVGGEIKLLAKDSVIAGGNIFCRESVRTSNLGFKRGAVTHLEVGVDWKQARSVDVKKRRLERLQKQATDDRQALRELVQKKQAQMTARHKELKEELQERLTRLRVLIERLEAGLAQATAQVTYGENVRVYVRELLAANVQLLIGGQVVAVVTDVMSACILPKRRRGSFIVALEDVEKEEAEGRGGAESPKKAG